MKIYSVYIAARFSRKEEMREHAKRLRGMGITVTSSWLDEEAAPSSQMGDHSPEYYQETSLTDIWDIKRADAVLFFAEDPMVGTPRGGRHVEFGYALGIGRDIYVIGPRENIFHYTPRVKHFDSMDHFVEVLG